MCWWLSYSEGCVRQTPIVSSKPWGRNFSLLLVTPRWQKPSCRRYLSPFTLTMACLIYLSLKARHLEVHRVFGEKAGMMSRNVSLRGGGGWVVVSSFQSSLRRYVLDKLSFGFLLSCHCGDKRRAVHIESSCAFLAFVSSKWFLIYCSVLTHFLVHIFFSLLSWWWWLWLLLLLSLSRAVAVFISCHFPSTLWVPSPYVLPPFLCKGRISSSPFTDNILHMCV